MAAPTPGAVVQYIVSEEDLEAIDAERQRTGAVGEAVTAGVVLPAAVVRVADGESPACGLRVWLPGPDVLWAPDRPAGMAPGCWVSPTVPTLPPAAG